MTEIRRKLYRRGSSYETTIPKPLLFAVDTNRKTDVVFKYDAPQNRWFVEFEPTEEKEEDVKKKEARPRRRL